MPETRTQVGRFPSVFDSTLIAGSVGTTLYECNAFRMTGLPTASNAKDISRFSERLEVQQRLGTSPSFPGHPAFPLRKAAGADDVREALQRLREPEQRLLDEFFWFWPRSWDRDEPDDATSALRGGDAATAARLWRDMLANPDESATALHNIAVLEHLRALEQPSAQKQDVLFENPGSWFRAYRCWTKVLESNEVWRVLARRVEAARDPRLTTAAIQELRSALPAALLASNAALVRESAMSGDSAAASRYSASIASSGFDDVLVERCIKRLVEPEASRLEALCTSALSSTRVDAKTGCRSAESLLAQSKKTLGIVDMLLPREHARREELWDRVAGASLSCLVGYANATEDWERVIQLTREAGQIAASTALRARIAENVRIIEGNRQSAACWFCNTGRADAQSVHKIPMHGDVTRESRFLQGTRVQWRHQDIEVPRCPNCLKTHTRVGNLSMLGGAFGAVAGFASCNGASDDGFLGILLVALCVAVGAFLGNRMGWAGTAKRTKPIAAGRDFPTVKELRRVGWGFGKKPSGVN